jgi:DNA-binding protein Fis
LDICDQFCSEKGVEKKDFRPNQNSKDAREKRAGQKLSDYRKALTGKGSQKIYEPVNNLIQKRGYGHFLKIQSAEEEALEKWTQLLYTCDELCNERGIEKKDFRPNNFSKIKREKQVAQKVSNYRQALTGKGKQIFYESVNTLIRENGYGHFLTIKSEEEEAVERWTEMLDTCDQFCSKRGIEKKDFRPTNSSKDAKEKRVGALLSYYRQALKGKGRGAVYESVNVLIRERGYCHFLKIQSAEEEALEKWKEMLDICDEVCSERGVEKKDFRPSGKSKDSREKRAGQKLSDYRKALNGKGSKKIYESVNSLIRERGYGHFLEIVGEKRLRSDSES